MANRTVGPISPDRDLCIAHGHSVDCNPQYHDHAAAIMAFTIHVVCILHVVFFATATGFAWLKANLCKLM